MADVISANRKLTEELLYRMRSLELSSGHDVKPVSQSEERPRLGEQ